MKLRNKKTGKVIEWFNNTDDIFPNSLAELNEEWEDYEEPKEYWFIKDGDCINHCLVELGLDIDRHKSVGNYFESKEEAEKAVEKLKAWKRLKDKGFDFVGCFKDNTINYEFVERPLDYDEAEEAEQDLALLFGGEE